MLDIITVFMTIVLQCHHVACIQNVIRPLLAFSSSRSTFEIVINPQYATVAAFTALTKKTMSFSFLPPKNFSFIIHVCKYDMITITSAFPFPLHHGGERSYLRTLSTKYSI